MWSDNRSGLKQVYFQRFDADGAPVGDEVALTNTPDDSGSPVVRWTGAEHVVLFSREGGVEEGGDYFIRLDPTGNSSSVPVLISGLGTRGTLVWSGTVFGLTLHDSGELRFAVLGPMGQQIGSPVLLATASVSSSLVWTGAEFAATWIVSVRSDQGGHEV